MRNFHKSIGPVVVNLGPSHSLKRRLQPAAFGFRERPLRWRHGFAIRGLGKLLIVARR